MIKRFPEFLPICLGLCSACILFGYGLGTYVNRRDWEIGAVKAGHGEWITSESGWSTFKWKTIAAPTAASENE